MLVPLFNTFPNENGDTNLNLEYAILIDDTLDTIYKKILYSYPEHYYKYIKLNLKIYAEDKLISDDIILTDKSLYSYISSDILMNNIPLKFEIYLTNISDIINENRDGFFINAMYLDFQSSFEMFYSEYPYLTLDVIKYLTYLIFGGDIKTNEMKLNSEELIENYQAEEDRAILLSKSSFTIDEAQFYKELQRDSVKVIPILDSLNIVYKPKEQKDYYINLLSIYNYIELSDTMPFIGISKKFMKNKADYTRDPLVRIYNKTNASAKEIQNWMMTKRNNILYYKKISGILIKYKIDNNLNYLSISITSNNIIKVEWNDIQSNKNIDLSYTNCINLIEKYLNNFITILNTLPKVTLQRSIIPLIDRDTYNMYISSIDTKTEIPIYISKNVFLKILNKQWIQKRFLLKNTKALDTIYLLYIHDNLSISFRDNLYDRGSVVMIYNAKNFFQINVIINELIAIYNTIDPEFRKGLDDLQIINKRSIIKDLRSSGAEITARQCQGKRQPILYDPDSNMPISTYLLEYNGIRYTCSNKDYPYPGVQSSTGNQICCFKADQRTKPQFIKKIYPKLLNTIVQPSNFKVFVEFNNKKIETFILKVIYSMDNDIKYNWISDDNKLYPIKNADIIEEIEKLPYNIWLEPTELYNLINLPQKTKCNTPPDIYNKNNDNINESCKKYPTTPNFTYNKFSVPCCINTPPIDRADDKKKIVNPFAHDIIKTERILSYNRLGELYPNLSILFNKYFITNANDRFYRLGVNQDTYSFLNTLLITLNMKNALDIIKAIENYLIENPGIFRELNGGQLYLKFKTIQRYIAFITKKIDLEDTLDILQIMYKINIHVFDIPLKTTEYSKEYLYEKMIVVCKYKRNENYNRNIILLRKSEYYENLVVTNNNVITYLFDNNSRCIQFLDIYYQKSCKTIEKYPEEYKYTKLLHVSEIKDLVTVAVKYPDNINISFVVINNILFPVQEISITDIKLLIPGIKLSELIPSLLVSLDMYLKKMDELNAILIEKKKQPFTLLGYTTKQIRDKSIKLLFDNIFKNKPSIRDLVNTVILKGNTNTIKLIQILNKLHKSIPNFPDTNEKTIKNIAEELILNKTVDNLSKNYINNILTSYNINVPLQDSLLSPNMTLTQLDYQTMSLQNIYLQHESPMDRVDTKISSDHQNSLYNRKIRKYYYDIFKAKSTLANKMNELILEKLLFQKKFMKIKKLLEKIKNSIPGFPVTNDIILSEIVRQIIDDQTIDYLAVEKVKENDNESILQSIDDIFTWIRNFK
jgi:hypothetical protein